MLSDLCDRPYIDKTRYLVHHDKHEWEIDVFHGDNEGLIVAELELSATDEEYTQPNWLGQEVTEDTRFYNICLVTYPYKDW